MRLDRHPWELKILRKSMIAKLLPTLVLTLAMTAGATLAQAQSTNRGASGLPLPRFVSLKAAKVNMRVGPGIDYAISWRYTRSGMPMEVIQEYDNWRKVRDAEGAEGWINQALLSGERTAIAAPWMRNRGEEVYVEMYGDREARGRLVAKLAPGVVLRVNGCDGNWCESTVDGASGWVSQQEIWGAYPGEAFR
jgi:SH3-like domain-containing protein